MGDLFDALCERVEGLWREAHEPAPEELAAIARAVDRATDKALRTHRQAKGARSRLEKAECGGLSRIRWVALNGHGPGQVIALIELAVRDRTANPGRSLDWAELAVKTAEKMDGVELRSLRARAWAEKGNAERIHERFGDARRSLDRALALLETAGGGDLIFRGEVYSLLASLEHALHRPQEALRALDEAEAIPKSCKSEHLQYSLLVKRANVLTYKGDFEAALRVLGDAGLPPLARNEQEFLFTWHNSLWILTEVALCSPRGEERQQSVELVYRSFPDLSHLYERNQGWSNRRNWLFARLAFAEGHLELARQLLEAAARSLTEASEMTTAALVTLDLCLVYARLGRFSALRRVARSACQIFQATGLSRSHWAAHQLLLTCDRNSIEAVIIEGLVSAGGASLRRRTPK